MINHLEVGGQPKYSTHFIIKLAKSLLPKEKQLIIDSFDEGFSMANTPERLKYDPEYGIEHFNETYKQ